MPTPKSRVINGVTYDYAEYLKFLTKSIREFERLNEVKGVRAIDLIDAWWHDPYLQNTQARADLNKEMNRLAVIRGKPVLDRLERGRYTVADYYKRHGAKSFDHLEKLLVSDLVANGGHLHFKKVRAIFDLPARKGHLKPLDRTPRRQARNRKRDYDEWRDRTDESRDIPVANAMRDSKLIGRHHGLRGFWSLHPMLLAAIPAEGRWAFDRAKAGVTDLPRKTHSRDIPRINEIAEDLTRHAYSFIGETYLILRQAMEMSRAELLEASPEIAEAAKKVAAHRDLDGLHARLEQYLEFKDLGRLDELRNIPKSFEAIEHIDQFPEYVMTLFEKGAALVHRAALSDWHDAFASYYRINAADLSRGFVAGEPRLDDVRPHLLDILEERDGVNAWPPEIGGW